MAALFLAGPAYLPPAARPAVLSSSSLRMQIARKPGEGDPFSAEVAAAILGQLQPAAHAPAAPPLPLLRPHRALPAERHCSPHRRLAQALATWDYVDETSRVPPPVTAASLSTADAGYIENDDEPWHSTCVSKAPVITKGAFDQAYVSSLPFVAPEEALQLAMSSPTLKLKDIDGAIAKCIADGGRKGCPAIVAAEKIKKAADKDGNVKPGKAPSAPAQAGGWDAMKRAVAKTHDNSVA